LFKGKRTFQLKAFKVGLLVKKVVVKLYNRDMDR